MHPDIPKLVIRSVCAGLLALGLLPRPAPAQSVEDQGTFRVWVRGQEVGEEKFSIRPAGGPDGDLVASGRVLLDLPDGSLELRPRLRARGFPAAALVYEADIGGSAPGSLVARLGGGRLTARIQTAAGEQLREYVASAGAVVLDDAVAHHYYLLAQRAHTGRVPIIIPRENRQMIATVTDRGEERIAVGGATLSARHLVVAIEGGADRHVWVDAANRVLKVEIPQHEYLALRTRAP